MQDPENFSIEDGDKEENPYKSLEQHLAQARAHLDTEQRRVVEAETERYVAEKERIIAETEPRIAEIRLETERRVTEARREVRLETERRVAEARMEVRLETERRIAEMEHRLSAEVERRD
jgi:hypothetical protein